MKTCIGHTKLDDRPIIDDSTNNQTTIIKKSLSFIQLSPYLVIKLE